jgi:Homeodomain-like domain-containing protein
MNVVYRVDLSSEECEQLSAVVASKAGAQKRKRAQILLAASKGVADIAIAEALPCGLSTIYRTKKRFVTEGLEASLIQLRRTISGGSSVSDRPSGLGLAPSRRTRRE